MHVSPGAGEDGGTGRDRSRVGGERAAIEAAVASRTRHALGCSCCGAKSRRTIRAARPSIYRPAAVRSASVRSVRSQEKLGSSRPKWP